MLKRSLVWVGLVALAGLGLVRGTPAAQAEDPSTQKYNAAELKDLVAPVALYPDVVLGSMLPASTAPNDVKAAAAYLASHGGKVDAVPEGSTWDKSVQAMLQYPDVLTWMNDNPTWMEQMAFAVAVQQSEVLAAVQAFRAEVQKAGNLQSNQYQTINVESAEDGDDIIVIQPTNPEVVYVPTYQPTAVVTPGYTGWGWGWGFAAGVFTSWAWHEINWGNHWGGGSININNNINNNIGNNIGNRPVGPNRPGQWQPGNRPNQRPGGGVNRPTQLPANRPGMQPGQRPGGTGVRPPAQRPTRPSTRPGQVGGARPTPAPGLPGAGAGHRPGAGAGQRPGGGAGAGQRPGGGAGAGQRPGGGAGAGAGARPQTRPATRPSTGFGGAGGASGHARAQSQRGGASLRGSSGGSSFKGHSRGGGGHGGGASRGGGSRGGGGGRGGGGRRR